jgi:hypothetical protein
VISTQGRLLVPPDPSFLRCFLRPRRLFRPKPGVKFLSKTRPKHVFFFCICLHGPNTRRINKSLKNLNL